MSLALQRGRIAVRVEGASLDVERALALIYAPFVVDEVVGPQVIDGTIESGDLGIELLVDALELALGRWPGAFSLHAAAVADDLGLIVLPGTSGSGKTALAVSLAAAGLVFVSDEFVNLEPNGTIQPYPRAAAVRAHPLTLPAGPVRRVETEDETHRYVLLDARADLSPRVIGVPRLVFVVGDRGDAITPLTPAEAAARLIPSVFDWAGREAEWWPEVVDLTGRARSFEVGWGVSPERLMRVLGGRDG